MLIDHEALTKRYELLNFIKIAVLDRPLTETGTGVDDPIVRVKKNNVTGTHRAEGHSDISGALLHSQ